MNRAVANKALPHSRRGSTGTSQPAKRLLDAASRLSEQLDQLRFDDPVTHVYNPLRYAWDTHRQYLELVGKHPVRVLFLGMNPGPWGMAQTGVPFGEISAARDWLGIDGVVSKPNREHPKRPIEGFACSRSEVSGRRLWGLFADRFKTPTAFFQRHFVANYCPLVFMESSGRNRTPDKLPASERRTLDQLCDEHLIEVLSTLTPRYVVGIGVYAESCLKRCLELGGLDCSVARILHPSPASPSANQGWAEKATQQLVDAQIWKS
ncbi:MAG: uracil-DNA glycosylase family protein [Planctomycetota bacterium]